MKRVSYEEIEEAYSVARSWKRAAEILSARLGLRVDYRSLNRAYREGRSLVVRDKKRLGTSLSVLPPEAIVDLWRYIERTAQSLYWKYGDWAVENARDEAKDFFLRLDIPSNITSFRARLAYARRAVWRFLLNYKRDRRWESPIDPQEVSDLLGEKQKRGGYHDGTR